MLMKRAIRGGGAWEAGRQSIRRVLAFIARSRGVKTVIVIECALMVVTLPLGVIMPLLSALFLDWALVRRDPQMLFWLLGISVGLAVVLGGQGAIMTGLGVVKEFRFRVDVEKQMLHRVTGPGEDGERVAHDGVLFTQFNKDVGVVTSTVTRLFPSLLMRVLNTAGLFVACLYMNAGMTLLLCSLFPVQYAIDGIAGRAIAGFERERLAITDQRMRGLHDVLRWRRSIAANRAGPRFVGGVIVGLQRALHVGVSQSIFQVMVQLATKLTLGIVAGVILVLFLLRVTRGEISVGYALGYGMLLARFYRAASGYGSLWRSLIASGPSLERVHALMGDEARAGYGATRSSAVARPAAASIAMDGLVVGRPGSSWVPIGDVFVEAGGLLIIRGGNGSGKTTLLETLIGLRDACGGSVRIGGYDPRDIASAWFRRSAGVFWCDEHPQDTRRASGSGRSLGETGLRVITGLFGSAPKLIVLDEPLAHLDGRAADAVLSMIISRPEHTTVVMTNHGNSDLVRGLGGVVVDLDDPGVMEHRDDVLIGVNGAS